MFGHIQASTKMILVFQETQLQDSYNLNTLSGPGRNAYKSIAVLQKPGLHQQKILQNKALQNLCSGPRTQAFVEEMVSPMYMEVSIVMGVPKNRWFKMYMHVASHKDSPRNTTKFFGGKA